jgi:Transposase
MGCRYAGIDWASDKHDVLVADDTGQQVVAATFAHDEKGLSALCRTSGIGSRARAGATAFAALAIEARLAEARAGGTVSVAA